MVSEGLHAVSVASSLVTRVEMAAGEVAVQHPVGQSQPICVDGRIGCQAPFPRRTQAHWDQSQLF